MHQYWQHHFSPVVSWASLRPKYGAQRASTILVVSLDTHTIVFVGEASESRHVSLKKAVVHGQPAGFDCKGLSSGRMSPSFELTFPSREDYPIPHNVGACDRRFDAAFTGGLSAWGSTSCAFSRHRSTQIGQMTAV